MNNKEKRLAAVRARREELAAEEKKLLREVERGEIVRRGKIAAAVGHYFLDRLNQAKIRQILGQIMPTLRPRAREGLGELLQLSESQLPPDKEQDHFHLS